VFARYTVSIPLPQQLTLCPQRERQEDYRKNFISSQLVFGAKIQHCSFFAPKTRGWTGSFSALNLQGTKEKDSISLPVMRLTALLAENGHSKIDLLKMDIEGAEYRVIDEILTKKIPIGWLCIEFDQPVPFWTTNRTLQRLKESGYELYKVDRWNFVFRNVL